MTRVVTQHLVTCPTCGETRQIGYPARWAILRGLNSGDCNDCAAAKRARPLTERLLAKIGPADDNGCWPWIGHRNKRGYGSLTNTGSSRLAHRLVYEVLVGPIPDGLTLDHLCRNPSCVNPGHLEPVTHEENVRRAADADRTNHCPAGHLYDAGNTYVGANGYRKCRACRREKAAAAHRARRARCA